jgi:heme exporter protein A
LSFVAGSGECLQITGANGSGKTTLLRALCGLVPLEQGRICWRGSDIAVDPGRLPQRAGLSGPRQWPQGRSDGDAENLRYGLGLRRRVARGLPPRWRTPAWPRWPCQLRRLSAGQRRRVALARLVLTGGGAVGAR